MPLQFFIVEQTLPGHHSTGDLTGWRSDFTVAGTANEFHTDFPPAFQLVIYNYLFLINQFKV